tara:strand:- start:518 stop:619 length:102 start_codon:yes stop_codon:yes gene_type:complete
MRTPHFDITEPSYTYRGVYEEEEEELPFEDYLE